MPIIVFLFTLPLTLTLGWGWVVLLVLLGTAHKLKWNSTLVLTAQWRPWVEKFVHSSATFGRGTIYQSIDRGNFRVRAHAAVHIRQVEDMMLLSLLVGLVLGFWSDDWRVAFLVWWSGGLWQIPNHITAVLRGGDAHIDAEHERSAYAQTDIQGGGQSWLERHRERTMFR